MAEALRGSIQDIKAAELGQRGTTLIKDTAAHSGFTWFKIKTITACTFTALTDRTRDGNALSAFTWPANFTIEGQFTVITLGSGKCIAYKTAVNS